MFEKGNVFIKLLRGKSGVLLVGSPLIMSDKNISIFEYATTYMNEVIDPSIVTFDMMMLTH